MPRDNLSKDFDIYFPSWITKFNVLVIITLKRHIINKQNTDIRRVISYNLLCILRKTPMLKAVFNALFIKSGVLIMVLSTKILNIYFFTYNESYVQMS